MNSYSGRLIFVTDPICSWCWAILPEMFKIQAKLRQKLSFELKCAGLQVGSQQPLTDEKSTQLINLWQQVAETTGQQFAMSLPADRSFIYHSELACRTVQIARDLLNAEPWDLFHRLQESFYLGCRNIGDLEELYNIIEPMGISHSEFLKCISSDQIVSRTRLEFDWCSKLETQALPALFLNTGSGPQLVCGGFATAEYLVPEITGRLTTR